MGAKISKISKISKRGSYNLKQQQQNQERSLSGTLQRSYSVINLSEAKIYEDDVVITSVVTAVDPRDALIQEIKDRINISNRLPSVETDNDDVSTINTAEENDKTPEVEVERNDKKEKELEYVSTINAIEEDVRTPEVQTMNHDEKEIELGAWNDPFNDEFWQTSGNPVKKECDDQIVVKESNEEQTEIINDEQTEVIQEDTENLISDINKASAKVVNNLKDIQKQLEPIFEEYLEVQTNQSKNETIAIINDESNKSQVSAIILSNREEQIEVPQVDSNCNGGSITDLNLEITDEPEASKGIRKNKLTKTISANSELSYKSIHNSDVESNASDTFYDADDQESANSNEYYDEQLLEEQEGERVKVHDELISQPVTNGIIECVNEQARNEVFEKISIDDSMSNAQIEVFDEIKSTKVSIKSEQEEEVRSLPESMDSFEIQENFDTISNFSIESKHSGIAAVENSPNETTESVQTVQVDDDTSHEIDIKFQISEKLSQVENEKTEIEIENYLSIERESENQLDESTAEIAAASNEITKVTEENSENLNLEQTTVENTNKSIDESFSNHTLHETFNIIESNDTLLNNSEVKNVASSETVNFENSDEVKLSLNNDIDEEVEIIISQINTVIEELNYLKEQIDNLTSEMHEEHNISKMYQTLIKLMRNVNAIKYADFNEKIINLQHEAVDKIHDCLTKLKSVQAAIK